MPMPQPLRPSFTRPVFLTEDRWPEFEEFTARRPGYLHVAQSLLPLLWRSGSLSGRRFSVLMTRLPLHVLHARLEVLAAIFPERHRLRESRAPTWMAEAETEALQHAEHLITPHSLIARFAPAKTIKLPWKFPRLAETPAPKMRATAKPAQHVAFFGPNLARSGAWEVREVMQSSRLAFGSGAAMHLAIRAPAASEEEHFWDGVNVVPAADPLFGATAGAGAGADAGAAVVVHPAFIEPQPRPLLRALACGIPVIATAECGLDPHPLLTLVPAGRPENLQTAIEVTLNQL
jgi:hypothetical protein